MMHEPLISFSDAVRASTLKRLRAVPQGFENWKVSSGALSFADVAQHLVDTDEWLLRKLRDPSVEPIQARAGATVVASRSEYDALLDALARSGQRRARKLASLEPEAWDERVYDERFGKEVSVWWLVVRGNLDHEIHHRGQIATYLRVLSDRDEAPASTAGRPAWGPLAT